MSDLTPGQKRCSKCGEIKPFDAFWKNKAMKDGCQNQCKACRTLYNAANRHKEREYRRAHYAANAERIRARVRARYATNAEKICTRYRAWYAKNAELLCERKRAWYAKNIEALRTRQRIRQAINVEKVRAWNRAWRVAHPESGRVKSQRRRALIMGNGGKFAPEEFAAMCIAQNGICAYCKGQYEPDELSIDHVIPLKQGGRHEAANIVLACKSCNSSKCDRTPEQWTNRWYLRQPLASRPSRKKKNKPQE